MFKVGDKVRDKFTGKVNTVIKTVMRTNELNMHKEPAVYLDNGSELPVFESFFEMARNDNRKPFDIPTITDSLRADVLSGKITIDDAALELHRAGWSTCIDVEKTRRLLKLEKEVA